MTGRRTHRGGGHQFPGGPRSVDGGLAAAPRDAAASR